MIENNKFFGLDGLLGRRGFIINYLIVSVITGICITTPYLIYLFFINPESILNLTMTSSNLWLIFGQILSVLLLFPSIVRRIRDINHKLTDNNIFVYSVLIVIFMLFALVNVSFIKFLAQWFSFAAILALMSISGELNNLPKSEIIKFNWGAFIGTWIWGMFNKAPITLLMIPFMFTPASFAFSIICGLKGNEWAYKCKKYNSIDDFHESQKKQTIIWSILSPIISLFILIAMFMLVGTFVHNYANSHPDFKGNIESTLKNYQKLAINSYFSDVKKEGDYYSFYMDPKVWVKMSDSAKMSVFNSAQRYIETENNVSNFKNSNNVDLLNKIKIKSSFNNETLGEFYIDEQALRSTLEVAPNSGVKGIKELIKTVQQGYRFNNHPSLP